MMAFGMRHVEVFWAVMTTGSATAAARLLHTSQPTISRELARFEQVTQLTLFTRTHGKLVPTEQALTLFDAVQRAYVGLDTIARAADALRHFSQGQVAIACLPAYAQALLPRACQQFCAQFPGVSLKITPQETALLQESLGAQRFHLGLTEEPAAPRGTVIATLLTLDLVCVIPPDHPLSQRADKVLTPHDFAGQNVVYLAAGDPYRHEVDRLFAELGIARRMVVETVSASAVCEMVVLGMGIAIVNPLTALLYAGRGLLLRRFSHAIPYTVHLVRPQYRPGAAVVDSFIDVLRTRCGQMEAELHALTA